MTRYSAHEHTAKLRNRPAQPSDRAKGILARIYVPVLDGDTRRYDYAAAAYTDSHRYPIGTRVHLRVVASPTLNEGIPFIQLNHNHALTLIERPVEGRLRLLFSGTHGGWIEVDLSAFTRCLHRATTAYGRDLPTFTTPVMSVTFVPTPRPANQPANRQ